MVAALGFIRSGMFGGSFALFCFQIPSAIIMAAAGLLMRNETVTQFLMNPPAWVIYSPLIGGYSLLNNIYDSLRA